MTFKRKLVHRKYPPDQLKKVYRFIRKYQEREGVPPSNRAIASHFGAGETVVRVSWIPRMVEAQMITRLPRSIKLLPLQETQTQEA